MRKAKVNPKMMSFDFPEEIQNSYIKPFQIDYKWRNPYVCRFGMFTIATRISDVKEWLSHAPRCISMDIETCGDQALARTKEESEWIKEKGGLDTDRCIVMLTSLAYSGSALVVDHTKVDVKETFLLLKDYDLVMHNATFDAAVMERVAGYNPTVLADTLVAYGMITAGIRPSWMGGQGMNKLGLETLCKHYLNVQLHKSVRGSFASGVVDVDSMIYSAEDAYATILCWDIMQPQIDEMGLHFTFYDIEMPLNLVLRRLQVRGVDINYEEAKRMETLLLNREAELEAVLAEEGIINPKSNVEILKWFRAKGITTKSANKKFLQKMAETMHIADVLLRYRGVVKFRSSFIEPWTGKHFNPYTRRIHPSFTQTFVETGRLSCREPNMQQIPKNQTLEELADIDIRGLISPGEGNLLVTADYSQYELRVLAELSGDKRMISEFQAEYEQLLRLWEVMKQHGIEKWQAEEVDKLLHTDELAMQIKHDLKFLDKHTQTAATIFNLKPDEVQKAQRSQAKAVSFGIVYGMGARSLAQGLTISMGKNVTVEYAEKLLATYFKKYPGVRNYIDSIKRKAQVSYKSSTPLGRSRRFPIIVDKSNTGVLSSMSREAVNMTVQGSNGDVTKLAMIDLANVYKDRYPDIWPIMNIHDEIVTVCPASEGNEVAAQVERAMVEASQRILKRVPTSLGITLSNVWEKD